MNKTEAMILGAIAFAIILAITAIATVSVYNTNVRTAAYRECLVANQKIAETLVSEHGTIGSHIFPSCYLR